MQIFVLSPRRRILHYGIAAFFFALPCILIFSGGITDDESLTSAGFITALVMLPFMGLMVFWAYYPRLVVSSEGIAVRGTIGLATLAVRWEDIESLRLKRLSEGLILREPSKSKAALKLRNWSGISFAGAPLYEDSQMQLINDLRFVPIEAFAYWLEHGTLLAAIRQYAPSLAENFGERRREASETKPSEKKALIIVFSVTALVLIGAVLLGIYYSELAPSTQRWLKRIEHFVLSICLWAAAFAFAVYSISNLSSAFRFARARQFGMAAVWLVMAVIQILLALLIVSS